MGTAWYIHSEQVKTFQILLDNIPPSLPQSVLKDYATKEVNTYLTLTSSKVTEIILQQKAG